MARRSQDNQIVTLYVAAAATLISVGGLYVPGGDSVFALVVLAVYGLGGIFVPLLIVRWTGYKPDTFHSIVMMISAFTGVIVWTFLGLGEDVFPSVPGVGSAFIAHFIMCAVREDSASNPFGRFEISQERRRQFATVGIIALCFVGVAEGPMQSTGRRGMENRVQTESPCIKSMVIFPY